MTVRRQAQPPEPAVRERRQVPGCVSLGPPQAREVRGGHHEAEALGLPSHQALGAPKPGGSVRSPLIP